MHTSATTAIICLADHALPRLPVAVHRSPAGSILVAGTARWCRYYSDLFFAGHERSCEPLGSWPVWRLPDLLDRWRTRVDLMIARVDRFSARRFSADRFLRGPEWVRMTAAVPRDGMPFPSSQARRNERLTRKNRLRWRLSHAPHDLATFIERDYRPYTRSRFGEDAFLRPARWFQDRFRRGGLIWIERDHDAIAGMTYDVQGHSLRRLAFACVRGDASLLRTGAASATYLACFDIARQLRCDAIDFRNCRPGLADGLLQVKRSWGGRVVEPDDITHDVLVGWHAATPAVTDFLARWPLVVRRGRNFAAVRFFAPDAPPHRVPPGVDHLLTLRPAAAFGDWTISGVTS